MYVNQLTSCAMTSQPEVPLFFPSQSTAPLNTPPIYTPPIFSPPIHSPQPSHYSLSSDDYVPAPGEWVGGLLVNPNRRTSSVYTSYTSTPPPSQPQSHYFNTDSQTDVNTPTGTASLPNSPLPSQARSASVLSWANTSRAPSTDSQVGPIRSQRGSQAPIRPGEDPLPPLSQQDVTRPGFRFGAKTYFVTWSQIGDLPNSALEDKLTSFGNQIKGISH